LEQKNIVRNAVIKYIHSRKKQNFLVLFQLLN